MVSLSLRQIIIININNKIIPNWNIIYGVYIASYYIYKITFTVPFAWFLDMSLEVYVRYVDGPVCCLSRPFANDRSPKNPWIHFFQKRLES